MYHSKLAVGESAMQIKFTGMRDEASIGSLLFTYSLLLDSSV